MPLPPLKLDRDGLVTVVVQDRATGEVRMVAHADEAAIQKTAETGLAHFYSRSRQRLWMKGEESGHTIEVSAIWVDCDADALIYLGAPRGPTCHTGAPSCFFTRAFPSPGGQRALPVLAELGEVLEARKSASAEKSYTRSLLDAGPAKIGSKIREEAEELARAVAEETDERVIAEAADLTYHVMVALLSRGIDRAAVERELARRFGISGHDEKAAR